MAAGLLAGCTETNGLTTTTAVSEPASTVTTAPTTTLRSWACSAQEEPLDLIPQPDLPEEVAATRQVIFEAAVACDYEALDALALEGTWEFLYDLEADFGTRAAVWASLEDHGRRPLAALAYLLNEPYVEAEEWTGLPGPGVPFVWPTYSTPPDEVFGTGISHRGEWLFFILGERLVPVDWAATTTVPIAPSLFNTESGYRACVGWDPDPALGVVVPESPFPKWRGGDELKPGRPWRYWVPIDGCGFQFLHFNGHWWKQVVRSYQPGTSGDELGLGDSYGMYAYPPDWDVCDLPVVGGPLIQVDGLVELNMVGYIEATTLDGDLIAVYEPTDEEPPYCTE